MDWAREREAVKNELAAVERERAALAAHADVLRDYLVYVEGML